MKNNLKEQESSLSHKYRCEKCRDLKFIINDNEAIPCECRALREAEEILKNSGISKEFATKTFENFKFSHDFQITNAFSSAKIYVNDFDNIKDTKNNSIIFMGQVGSGKTHLSLAISNDLMKKGVGVIYMSYRESILILKQNIMDSVNYNKAISKYKNAKVLLIDDLFKGSISQSDINIIFEIVNYRYFNNKPMIISTEKSEVDLLSIDEAIGSRILEMCKDRRLSIRGKKLNYRIYG